MEIVNKDAITSLELAKEINFFRKNIDGKSELTHSDLLKIIRDEFEEEIGVGNISQSSVAPIESTYINTQNKKQPMFVLTIEQAKQVLVRESKQVRRAVIKKLYETIYTLRCNEAEYLKIIRPLENIEFNGNIDNLVYSKNGKPITTSRIIAEYTGKEHKNILRDIRNEIEELKKISSNLSQSIINDFSENIYFDIYSREQTEYELGEMATMQILLKYSTEYRAKFIITFQKIKEALMNMFKVKLLEEVLPQDNRNRHYVYIIENVDNGAIKIGVGNNPDGRLKQLQTGSVSELELVYRSNLCSNAFEVEKFMHDKFSDKHIRGEWYSIDKTEVINELEKCKYVLKSELIENLYLKSIDYKSLY